MALRASFAAIVLLGSAFSGVSAAEAPAPRAPAPAEDLSLPRFEPDAAAFVATPVVQALPEASVDEGEAIDGGVASWYGNEFAGHRTASGERFNPREYTAAHRSLPFGSKVRVSYAGKSVVVRINDRGPFSRNRVIDLSQAAAEDLGLRRAGSGQVTLALLEE